MTPDLQEFEALFQRVRSGDVAATGAFVERFGPYLQRVIRHRLHRKLRCKFDSLDFVQDVWASFFARLPDREAPASPEQLVTFLEALARNKVTEAVRAGLIREKDNVNREQVSLNDSQVAQPPHPPARLPTPSTAAMSREEWDRLLASQPKVYRHILVLRREGKEMAQIAVELGLNERTVRRVITKLLPGLAYEECP
jgi:RNA polymerase sigma-70 factor (ECF subfamily)